VSGSKSHAILSTISTSLGNKRNTQKFEINFLRFVPCRSYFCLFEKLGFIPFGLMMQKLWNILISKELKHLVEKNPI